MDFLTWVSEILVKRRRYFMFSVSFNFGKMNAKKNSAVEDAMWNMMY